MPGPLGQFCFYGTFGWRGIIGLFCDSKLDSLQLWRKILCKLQETILAKCDMSVSLDPGEQTIERNLNLNDNNQGCTFGKRSCISKQHVCRDGRWSPPLAGILKINTDGSSRGNPCHDGIGAIGRGNDSVVVFMLSIYKGQYSNNLMEVLAIKIDVE